MTNAIYKNIISENNSINEQSNQLNLQYSTDSSIILYNNKSIELIDSVNNIFLILYFGFFFIFLVILFFNKNLNIYYKIGFFLLFSIIPFNISIFTTLYSLIKLFIIGINSNAVLRSRSQSSK